MRRLKILFLVIAVFLFASPVAHAEDITFMDGLVDLDLPQGWNIITSENYSAEAGEAFDLPEENVQTFFGEHTILLGQKKFAKGMSLMTLCYDADENGFADFESRSDKELAVYGQKSAEALVSSLLPETDGTVGSEWSEIEVLSGSWGPFLHMDVGMTMAKGSQYYQLYYTVKSGVQVSFVFNTGSAAPTEKQTNDAKAIVGSFYDYGHYSDYADQNGIEVSDSYSDDYDDRYDDGSSEIWIPFFVVLLIVGGCLIAKFAADSQKIRRSFSGVKKSPYKDKGELQKRTAAETPGSKGHRINISDRIRQEASDREVIRVQNSGGKAKTPEESYIESLDTLLSSGVLTKEEYREMLEKLDRNKRI